DRPTELDPATSASPLLSRSPQEQLPSPVTAQRTRSRIDAGDASATRAAKEAPDAASAPAENLRDYWIRFVDESNGSPVADARCDVGPYDFDLFQTAFLEWKGGPLVRTHYGSQSFADMARTTARSGGDGLASIQVPRERTLVALVTAEGFLPAWFVAST